MKNILPEKFTPVLLVVTIALAFGFGILWQKVRNLESGGTGTTAGGTTQTQPPSNVNIKDVGTKDEPFIGKADAPVAMAYWMDYQCPFCKKFETDTLPTLIEKYVNTGKLKIVFKDFQFLGSDSQTAGLFEHAVWETSPESFLKWQEAMFKKQDAENGGWGSKDDITALTKTISGIDTGKVLGLMESKKNEYQKELDDDKAEGGKFGISGTPGFVIGKQSISGAQPLNVFTQIIDAELSK
ncbi:MAG: thioredoxin domain-containing protein [bacterium]|nr:thioredoxin domain-containing protein [bacterium]